MALVVNTENGVVSETRVVLETLKGVGDAIEVSDLDTSRMTNWCIHKSTIVSSLRIWHHTESMPTAGQIIV
jgi:hypothetical protein